MLKHIIYRKGSKKDSQAIANLHIENWRKAYRDDMSSNYLTHEIEQERLGHWTKTLTEENEDIHLIIAEDEEKNLIGFVCYYTNYDEEYGSYIDNLHVHQKYRGKQIGYQLMVKTIEHLKTKYSNDRIYLWVLLSNTSARNFYLKMGGEEKDQSIWQMPGGGTTETVRCVF